MLQWLEIAARDAPPAKYQNPIKYWYGALRRELVPEMRLLPLFVRRGAHVADIGENRATCAFQLHCFGARLEIFKPNPLCADILDHWARSIASANVHRGALSNVTGTATLHIPIDDHAVEHDASASIEAVGEGRQRHLEVPLGDLDSFDLADLNFIKIDTEAHDGTVIAGAEATVRASFPAMLIEIDQRHLRSEKIEGLFQRILALGYRGYSQRGQRLAPNSNFDLARDQSLAAFEFGSAPYTNNFLFLAEHRIQSGEYSQFLSLWAPA